MSDSSPNPGGKDGCPYRIPEFDKPDITAIKRLDRSKALEFLRIEALLRSKAVWELYRSDKQRTGTILKDNYAVADGWNILLGAHHRLIQPFQAKWVLAPGIIDLQAMAKEQEPFFIGAMIRDRTHPRLLDLCLDTIYPPNTIWKALQPILKKRHRALQKIPREAGPWIAEGEGIVTATVPAFHPTHAPTFRDLDAWFKYLQCYDLRTDGQTYGAIAKKVYGTGDSATRKRNRDTAEKAVRRFKRLIRLVSRDDWRNDWPPSSRLLTS